MQLHIKALLRFREANDKLNILLILVFAMKLLFYKTVLSILTLNKFISSFKSPISRKRKLQLTLNPKP